MCAAQFASRGIQSQEQSSNQEQRFLICSMIGHRSRAADSTRRNSPNQIPSMISDNNPQTTRKRRSPSSITVYLHITLRRGLPSPTRAGNNIITSS
ncbi:hypothetical protein RchiOBHm_Chr2g0163311 [Rosa chinensis]|uniref:Uncharacterized protein n=1 Tax=Rosa chinensis TaxID=74649 RepID=A0A2P6S381_ROSCH|nr:hypothetical protein RchiOBHm_Chr2g0163311 [Rosa chinensis]